MRAGKLRNRVKLRRPTAATLNDAGAPDGDTFETVREVWASIDSLSGRKGVTDRKVVAEATHEIHLRAQADMDQTWRIVFGARVFRILDLRRPEERQVEVVVFAAETMDADQAVEAASA